MVDGAVMVTDTPTTSHNRTCSTDGCEAPTWAPNGRLCAGHLTAIDNHGYPAAWLPGHELAARNGNVRPHRLALFARIGPGEHPCYHCDRPVSWDVRDQADPRCLVVDHLDGDKRHNDPANLVPSCSRCNVRRAADARTHCRNGHLRTEANTGRWSDGSRRCLDCAAAAAARGAARRRAKRASAQVLPLSERRLDEAA